MSFIKCSLLLAAAAVASVSARRGPEPKYPPAAGTSSYCSYWVDYEGDKSCSRVLEDNKQNPTVGADCSGIKAGNSYCVEAFGEPEPIEVTTTTRAATTTTQPTATTTTFANGIATPQPTQSGMVTNCNKFHWIAEGRLLPACGPVSTSASASSAAPPTRPSHDHGAQNGVVTPQPTQPSMVTNCNKFHWIAKGVTCQQVISFQKISLADFVKWNPSVLSDCSEVQVCVGLIAGTTPTTTRPPTTTAPGNGVSTPQPTQPGMVTNCAKFHWVAKGVTCNQIYSYQKITLEQFVSFNPTVKSDCTGMQAEVNVCVGLIGGNPTPTQTGNGIATPQPIQPGMVSNCKKFHWIAQGVTCQQVISFQKITLADFVKWNTGVGSDCRTMWAETNVCVGV
ncbi:LysM domain-containing protein [Verticillium alfalfae VaMs.102]|uniref:LysM domain-containing protein n=1 Tax=Verticillium alfalfae (strain VaMs.102 / ATCC MYA-4576 / FGSC 10136) TaxID=526221 RepID=C9SKM1_VERA1|nr:LysM domain-containing protein [Verticillium alfalfae VaMs.102]EEY19239.1 LysM domain-containing protein [Verticillium alfalfae VaMs.102]